MAVDVTLSGGSVTNPDSVGVTSTVVGSVLSNPGLVNNGVISQVFVATGQGEVTSSTENGSAFIVTDPDLAVTVTGSSATNQLIAGNDVFGTTINTTNGSGTIVGGNAGTQIGLGTGDAPGGSYRVYAGPANDTIIASSGSNTITGGAGSNLIGLSGGGNTLYAAGNDTVFATGGNNVIGGGTGNSTVVASSGTNTIIGGSGQNNIFVSGGNSTVFAGSGQNNIFGTGNNALYVVGNTKGAGSAAVVGGTGNDTIIAGTGATGVMGGAGNNLFVFSTVFGGGSTTIGDFNAGGNNVIAVQGYSGVTSESLVRNAVVSGGNTVLTLPDNTTILLVGVTNLSPNSIVVG